MTKNQFILFTCIFLLLASQFLKEFLQSSPETVKKIINFLTKISKKLHINYQYLAVPLDIIVNGAVPVILLYLAFYGIELVNIPEMSNPEIKEKLINAKEPIRLALLLFSFKWVQFVNLLVELFKRKDKE